MEEANIAFSLMVEVRNKLVDAYQEINAYANLIIKMNFQKILKQYLEIWKQLGINQRVSIVLATVAVIGGLVAIGVWSARVDYSLLYGRLDDSEAGKVIASLNDAKVPYKTGAGGSIYVPADKVYSVRMQLAGKGIPRGEGVGF
jgi:flagellar M-ring protein FliF